MIRGIHHIAIHVHDIDRMVAFYAEAFGFKLLNRPSSWRENAAIDLAIDVKGSAGRMCMMQAGTCYIELFEYSAPAPNVTAPLRPFDKGYTHFCVDVTDIDQEYDRLKKLGMDFGDRPPADFRVARALYGRDPEGNLIEIQEIEQDGMRLDQLTPLAR